MKNKDLFIPLPLAKFSSEILASFKSFIKISPKVATTALSSTQSKFVGIPYWPKSYLDYPRDIKGNSMKMVAQLNFNEIHSAISDEVYPLYFPKDGLLQFFIPQHSYEHSYLGVCFDTKGNRFNDIAVIYHESLLSDDLSNNITDLILDNKYFPITNECELKFSTDTQFCPLTDNYYKKYFYQFFLNNLCSKQKIEFYESDEFNSSICKIDGYAHINEVDPRVDEYDENNPWILLLQIDSFQDNSKTISNWGDFGTANWFIRKNDLINKDFSKVLFNWDCY